MFKNLFSVFCFPELRNKIILTFFLVWICRSCSFVPIPGIDTTSALSYFKQINSTGQSLLNLVDIFSGGAFAQMTVGALGVIPYISASIILQLLVALWPSLHRDLKENSEYTKRKLHKWSRILTLCLSVFQSSVFAQYALSVNSDFPGIISDKILSIKLFGLPIMFLSVFTLVMTCGTFVVVWIGEQISEKGIGNGISLIISTGILSSLPKTLSTMFSNLELDSPTSQGMSIYKFVLLICLFVIVVFCCISLNHGERKIPVQYARRVVSGKEFKEGKSFLPLKVNHAGVMPIIFASSVLMFPTTMVQIVSKNGSIAFLSKISSMILPGTFIHSCIYAILIFFFNYFWTATQFHPDQIVSDMKKNGAFIPSIRQGAPTQEFIDKSMQKLTFIGAFSLVLLAEFPQFVANALSVDYSIAYFFGGTSILILVGVIMDTIKQINSYLMVHRYNDVVRKIRVRF